MPNFIKIGQTVEEIWRFNGFFSKWRPSAILDLLGADWDHPRRPVDGLYRCAKFGWNRCSSFDNMKLSRPQNWGFCGISPLKWGAMSTKPPKGTYLRESASCVTCRWVDERKVKKLKFFPYSLPSVGPGADPGVQAVSPQVTWSESRHIPSSSLPLLSARPAVTFVAFTRWRHL